LRSSLKSFISGGVGGMSLVAAGQPFDLIKVRLQTSNEYKSAVDCARRIIAKDGFLGLYRGMAAPLTGVTPIFATCFWGYDVGKQLSRWAYGQSADDKLSLNQIMFAGGFSAIPATAIMAPGERIKVVVQTNSSLKGPIDAIKFIRKEQGIAGLFKGTAATLARDVPGSVAYFGAYEVLKSALSKSDGSISPLAILFSGGMAGVANWVVAIPADVIKSRIQSATGKTSMANVIGELYKQEGIKGFFRGLGPVMLRAFPANAACFLGVEMSRKMLDRMF
jgi:solute carrier family 25 carnitine/acylcarnitine transporter 20/29